MADYLQKKLILNVLQISALETLGQALNVNPQNNKDIKCSLSSAPSGVISDFNNNYNAGIKQQGVEFCKNLIQQSKTGIFEIFTTLDNLTKDKITQELPFSSSEQIDKIFINAQLSKAACEYIIIKEFENI